LTDFNEILVLVCGCLGPRVGFEVEAGEDRLYSRSMDWEKVLSGWREATNSSSRARSSALEVVIMLQNITMKGMKGDMRMAL
jgi:hypothetical protein